MQVSHGHVCSVAKHVCSVAKEYGVDVAISLLCKKAARARYHLQHRNIRAPCSSFPAALSAVRRRNLVLAGCSLPHFYTGRENRATAVGRNKCRGLYEASVVTSIP